MSTIFKGIAGAAVLLAASATSASAQDYTWTLQNFNFGNYFDSAGDYFDTESGTTANGTLVLKKVVGGYALKSFNFTTTADGISGTGFAATYDSSSIGLYGTDSSPEFDTFIDMAGVATDPLDDTEFRFHLSWDNGALADEMNGNFGAGNLNAVVALDGLNSYEYDLGGNWFRYNDASQSFNNQALGDFPGQMQLTGITKITTVSTPEPASLALLGTGLLGIFAARRRKAV